MNEPEYASVEAFAQYLKDDERTTFSLVDLEKLGRRLHIPQWEIRKNLELMGFDYQLRELPKKEPRGFTANSHDRWSGPGSGN